MTSHYLLEFYSVDKKSIYSNYIYSNNIGVHQHKYKWYIFISNILNNLKEPYHQNILNLHKQLSPNNYYDSLNNLITKTKRNFETMETF